MLENILYLKFKKDKRALVLLGGLFSYIRDDDIVITKIFWYIVYRRFGSVSKWF